MLKIKNGGLDQYGAEPFEQQQFGKAGIEGVKAKNVFAQSYNNSFQGRRRHIKEAFNIKMLSYCYEHNPDAISVTMSNANFMSSIFT